MSDSISSDARPDIIDNQNHVMANVLNLNIPDAPHLDISSGFFDVGGYGVVRKPLEDAVDKGMRLRLLLGRAAITPSKSTFEEQAEAYRAPPMPIGDEVSVSDSADAMALGMIAYDDTASLLRILHRDTVHVRSGDRRFNHSKCYIFGNRAVIIGSSNFTKAGLAKNVELNAGLYQDAPWRESKAWFERMWNDAKDTKKDLIAALEGSKFGLPATPYEVYMKMLFEKYRGVLEAHKSGSHTTVALANFQKDAVGTAMQTLRQYKGVIIADVTGLGKTNMGIEIMRQYMYNGATPMVIAPAQVLDSMWNSKLDAADINVKQKYRISMEMLGRKEFTMEIKKFKAVDLVLVDESQNFRSKNANRHKNLLKLVSNSSKKVVLLTATPINNSLMDLYYQLRLITKDEPSYFWKDVKIHDLYKHMRDATNKDLDAGLKKIEDLLDRVMIRRTRAYIKQWYSDDAIGDKKLAFPSHEYAPIHYSIAETFGNVFKSVEGGLERLNNVPYGLDRYDSRAPDREKDKSRGLARLQTVVLLKRFESSIAAIRASVSAKIELYEYVRDTLEEGKIPRVKEFKRIMQEWRSHDREGDSMLDDIDANAGDEDAYRRAFFMERLKKVKLDEPGRYDLKQMLADVCADLDILASISDELHAIRKDMKIEAVENCILHDRALESGSCKVLLFTEYAETAKYVHGELKKRFLDKTVCLLTGSTKKRDRADYIRRFAPTANLTNDDNDDVEAATHGDSIDMLVSTEVLAEGQNLQDCNYVISYDLPWNPMRIVQRMGRVDRLGSPHDVVHSRACFPEGDLERLISLVGRLTSKIDTADKVVGLGEELLGIMPSPKNFNGATARNLRALVGGGSGAQDTITNLEAQASMVPRLSPRSEIERYVNNEGIKKMRDVPFGRRSGKKAGEQKAVLAYVDDNNPDWFRFVIYDYKSGKATVPMDDSEAIDLVRCTEDEEIHLPMDSSDPEHRKSFAELVRIDSVAVRALSDSDDEIQMLAAEARADYRKKYDALLKKIHAGLLSSVSNGEIGDNDAQKTLDILKVTRAWDDELDVIWESYEATKDATSLCRDVAKLGDDAGVSLAVDGEIRERTEIRPKLVGAMFISGDRFDSATDKKGLEKHMGGGA